MNASNWTEQAGDFGAFTCGRGLAAREFSGACATHGNLPSRQDFLGFQCQEELLQDILEQSVSHSGTLPKARMTARLRSAQVLKVSATPVGCLQA